MSKEEILDVLREAVYHLIALRDIESKTDFFCFGSLLTRNEVQLYYKHFYEIVHALQVTVHFNPNWSDKHPNTMEAYFYLNLDGKNYKFLVLLAKENK